MIGSYNEFRQCHIKKTKKKNIILSNYISANTQSSDYKLHAYYNIIFLNKICIKSKLINNKKLLNKY